VTVQQEQVKPDSPGKATYGMPLTAEMMEQTNLTASQLAEGLRRSPTSIPGPMAMGAFRTRQWGPRKHLRCAMLMHDPRNGRQAMDLSCISISPRPASVQWPMHWYNGVACLRSTKLSASLKLPIASIAPACGRRHTSLHLGAFDRSRRHRTAPFGGVASLSGGTRRGAWPRHSGSSRSDVMCDDT
jgi:hypothetical protein